MSPQTEPFVVVDLAYPVSKAEFYHGMAMSATFGILFIYLWLFKGRKLKAAYSRLLEPRRVEADVEVAPARFPDVTDAPSTSCAASAPCPSTSSVDGCPGTYPVLKGEYTPAVSNTVREHVAVGPPEPNPIHTFAIIPSSFQSIEPVAAAEPEAKAPPQPMAQLPQDIHAALLYAEISGLRRQMFQQTRLLEGLGSRAKEATLQPEGNSAQIATAREQVQYLVKQVGVAEQQNKGLTDKLAASQRQVATLAGRLAAAQVNEKPAGASGRFNSLKERIKELTGQLSAARAEVGSAPLAAAKQQIEDLTCQLSAAQAKVDPALLATAQQQIEDLTSQLNAARAKNDTAPLAAAQLQIKDLTAQVSAAKAKVDPALIATQKEIENLTGQLSTAQQEIQSLSGQLTSFQSTTQTGSDPAQLAIVQQQVQILTNQLNAAQTAKKQDAGTIQSLKSDLEKVKSEREHWGNQFNNAHNYINQKLLPNMKNMESDRDDLLAVNKRLVTEGNALLSEKKSLAAEQKDLTEQIERMKLKYKAAAQTVPLLKHQAVESRLRSAQDEATELKRTIASHQCATATAAVDNPSTTSSTNGAEVTKLKAAHATAMEQRDRYSRQVRTTMDLRDKVARQLEAEKKANGMMKVELDLIRSKKTQSAFRAAQNRNAAFLPAAGVKEELKKKDEEAKEAKERAEELQRDTQRLEAANEALSQRPAIDFGEGSRKGRAAEEMVQQHGEQRREGTAKEDKRRRAEPEEA